MADIKQIPGASTDPAESSTASEGESLTPSPRATGGSNQVTPDRSSFFSSANSSAAGWSVGDRKLTSAQHKALAMIRKAGEDVALVACNPLIPANPIVFANAQWQLLTGLTDEQAIGHPASLMQGAETSQEVTASIRLALAQRRACKALVVNCRAADPARPFWCMLSISPVLHGSELILWVASLRDYSKQMAKLRVRAPAQFCRATAALQRRRPLHEALQHSRHLCAPAVLHIEAGGKQHDQAAVPVQATLPLQSGAALPAPFAVRRLGWSGLHLEPEYLVQRVVDIVERLRGSHTLVERVTPFAELSVVEARFDAPGENTNANVPGTGGGLGSSTASSPRAAVGVPAEADDEASAAPLLHLSVGGPLLIHFLIAQDQDGTFCVTVSRISGATLDFHKAFRQVKRCMDLTPDDGTDGSERRPPRPAHDCGGACAEEVADPLHQGSRAVA